MLVTLNGQAKYETEWQSQGVTVDPKKLLNTAQLIDAHTKRYICPKYLATLKP